MLLLGAEAKGNCSHVLVDLSSLTRLEKDTRTATPSRVPASMWTTKYLVAIGLKRKYTYRPVRPSEWAPALGTCM